MPEKRLYFKYLGSSDQNIVKSHCDSAPLAVFVAAMVSHLLIISISYLFVVFGILSAQGSTCSCIYTSQLQLWPVS